ncbi:hypothetical protein AN963_07855 [Brevibacillus choshinensis]|uniref:ATP-dependent DNA ligase family profile domain-containing protein n=1 Tax=Brevibacillus choshinensis TaxID=54911 RepID=A0ABR5NDI7_BRECH|nr:hypothetical protein [Brevibacillus choshinensis]KQL49630.1 hypothetical protein AN963_07855 [Brevibacillus choshinensis]
MVWDILHYAGKDLRKLPLMERKSILHDVLPETSQINKIRYIETAGTALHNMIVANNLEGTVAKRKDSRYVGMRSNDWIKVILTRLL